MNDKKISCFVILMIALSIGTRCFFFPKELGHYDSFNFAFALDFYHLPSLSPHFPGYPWYILIAKLLYLCGCSKVVALTLPGFVASILSLGVLSKIADHYSFSFKQKSLLILFYAWNPLVSVTSLKAFSDSSALFCFLMSFKQTLYTRSGHAGLWAALGLGVRPSYAILIFPLLWQNRRRLRFFTGIFLITLVPLLYFYSIHLSWNEIKLFVPGHFTQWGGTVWTQKSWFHWIWLFWTHALGGFEFGRSKARCIMLFFLTLPLLNNQRQPIFFPKDLKHWILCYGVWFLVAQNLGNPRHLLPFIFPFALFLAGNLRKYFSVAFLLFIPYSLGTFSVLQDLQQPSLYTQFSELVVKQYTPLEVKIYGGKLLRIFDEPISWKWNKREVVHFSEVETDLRVLECCPPFILITSEVRSIPSFWKENAPLSLKLECSAWTYAPEQEVYLYHFSRETIQILLKEAHK